MTKECETLALDAQEHPRHHEMLLQFLTFHAAKPVRLDVSAITDVTAARLQLLISARKQRDASGGQMILAGVTDAFRSALARLGVPADYFEEESL